MKWAKTNEIYSPPTEGDKLPYDLFDTGRLQDILYCFGWYQGSWLLNSAKIRIKMGFKLVRNVTVLPTFQGLIFRLDRTPV